LEFKEIETTLEGILFAAGDPVRLDRLCAVMELDAALVDSAAVRLADHYRFERRGIRLVRLEDSYQLVSSPDCAGKVRKILEERKPPPMSRATLETLSIIAYHQPTTRAYIELVRGVDSSNTVSTLQDKGLIEECGRLDVPGRPALFRTTPIFLRCFGLQSLSDLPILDTPEGEIEGQVVLGGNVQGMEPAFEPSPEDETFTQ
jgi:segregation and condensation protein B